MECKTSLEQFIEEHFKPHPGILGGIVHYGIVSWFYSPDKKNVVFIVEGNDGHETFYPALYLADNRGSNITKIDSSSHIMCKDIVWLSNEELVYSKDSVLWRAAYYEHS